MANSVAQLEKLLDAKLAEPLGELGFERAQRLIFQREIPEVRQLIRFPTRLENKVMLFNANAAVRFERIETLLGNVDPLFPTLMMPIHLLRPNRNYLEWKLSSECHDDLVEAVVGDCRQYLLPLFASFSSIESLKSQLLFEIEQSGCASGHPMTLSLEAEQLKFKGSLQNDGKQKSVLSPDQRVEKLAAIFVLEGNLDSAMRFIDFELTELSKKKQLPPQIARRVRLETLKKSLNKAL